MERCRGRTMLKLSARRGCRAFFVSPWANAGAAPSAVTSGALIWLAVVEILSAAVGGYVAGRLRTRWVDLHAHEVISATPQKAAHMGRGLCCDIDPADVVGNFDCRQPSSYRRLKLRKRSQRARPLLHRQLVPLHASGVAVVCHRRCRSLATISLMFGSSFAEQELNEAIRNYVAEVVAAKKGMMHAAAQQFVTRSSNATRRPTDAARKAVAIRSIGCFAALLMGAFAASLAATYGGRQRDRVYV